MKKFSCGGIVLIGHQQTLPHVGSSPLLLRNLHIYLYLLQYRSLRGKRVVAQPGDAGGVPRRRRWHGTTRHGKYTGIS